MQGYTTRKGNRWYAVIYHGLDPITGREQRSWHAATDHVRRLAPQRRAAHPAGPLQGEDPGASPAATSNASTKPSCAPPMGHVPPSAKTVLELHLVIRGALGDAHRKGIVNRNVAEIAAAPKLRNIPPVEARARTEDQLKTFLHTAAGHRLYPAFWLSAATGMRRSEVLGLKWSDMNWERATVSISRGLVAIGYALAASRCKTRTSRRLVELDQTTLELLRAWRTWRHASDACGAVVESPWMFPADTGGPTHPHAFSQAFDRLVVRSGNPTARLHDLRHTHASSNATRHADPSLPGRAGRRPGRTDRRALEALAGFAS